MFLSLLRRHEGWFSLTLVAALLVLGFVSFQALFSYEAPPAAPAPVAQRDDPTLSVYPDHGPSGTYVSVTGSGWPGSAEVTMLLADDQGQSRVLAKDTTSADGSLSTGFLYPFDQRWLTPGSYSVIAESAAAKVRVSTPFRVSDSPLPETVAPAETTMALTPTPTALPKATTVAPPPPVPSPAPTDTTVPTPLPTATPGPPTNQPPQVQAALVPIDLDDDREAGVFQIQVAASDPEGNPPRVVTILQLPLGNRDRKVKLKEGHKTEIKFTGKALEIKAPDPQVILDQITHYGGIVVENGQQIDLRVKKEGEGKVQWEDERWRLEAPAIELAVIATDDAGVSSSTQVSSCLEKKCPDINPSE